MAPHGVTTTSFFIVIANIASTNTIFSKVIIVNVWNLRRAHCRCSRCLAGICGSSGSHRGMAGGISRLAAAMPELRLVMMLMMVVQQRHLSLPWFVPHSTIDM
jgi:hypothetical protein